MHRIACWLAPGSLVAGLTVACLACLPSSAEVLPGPTRINVQGRLTRADGSPLPDGPHTIAISLWDAALGGTQGFTQTVSNVPVTGGWFLTRITTLTPAGINGPLWAEFQVDGDAPMTPRVPFGSAPSALKANTVPDGSMGATQLAPDAASLNKVSGGAMTSDGTNLALQANSDVHFLDNGQISSTDYNHRILFRRSENILELREFGDIVLSPGATGGTATSKVMVAASGNVGIGTTAPVQKLDVNGGVNVSGEMTARVVTILGGSDVAEPYSVNAAGETRPIPGMVVALDADHIGQMRVSSRAYDKAVAGILSGANGIAPGITLRQAGTIADGTLPVASIGRVWCYCDADANGAITVGDLLTTSDTPGHAMRATDRERRDGAVIGKAMSPLASGRGPVLVLVSLK